jgi:hypothetical protein
VSDHNGISGPVREERTPVSVCHVRIQQEVAFCKPGRTVTKNWVSFSLASDSNLQNCELQKPG